MEFFKILRVDQALDLFLGACPQGPLGTEAVPLSEALGRVLVADVKSKEDLPGFARSTVDGFAVVAEDTFGASEGLPAYLRVVGEVLMGQEATVPVGPGECVRVATGGMIPPGADAMVMVEHTESLAHDEVGVVRPASPGQNVIRQGEDAVAGTVLVPAGQRLRAQELGLLAHAGVLTVTVVRQPKVGIVTTGDELVEPHETPALGQIRESNSYTIAALVQEAGCVPVYLGKAKDTADDIGSKLKAAWEQTDVVMVSGGSSVGTRDLAADLLHKLGEPGILVHGVSLKPGKPTILGLANGKPIMGLPGHPVSSQVVFHLFAKPMLRRLQGLAPQPAFRPTFRARLAKNYASAAGRVDVLRVSLMERDGELWAEPIQGKSGLISTLTKADGLVIIREQTEGLLTGDWVEVEPI